MPLHLVISIDILNQANEIEFVFFFKFTWLQEKIDFHSHFLGRWLIGTVEKKRVILVCLCKISQFGKSIRFSYFKWAKFVCLNLAKLSSQNISEEEKNQQTFQIKCKWIFFFNPHERNTLSQRIPIHVQHHHVQSYARY